MPVALSLALVKTGNSIAARMAMMAMTTNNSINVKAEAPARLHLLFVLNMLMSFQQTCLASQDSPHSTKPPPIKNARGPLPPGVQPTQAHLYRLETTGLAAGRIGLLRNPPVWNWRTSLSRQMFPC